VSGRGAQHARLPRGHHFLRSRAFAEELVHASGVRAGTLVLDLGAGRGILTRSLADAGARVVAVELDPAMAEWLRRLRSLLDDPGVPLVRLDAIVEWGLAAKRTAVWPSTLLGCTWGAWYELSVARRVPRPCFVPPPSVDGAVLRAVRRSEPLVPATEVASYLGLLRRAFGARAPIDRVLPRRVVRRVAARLGFDPGAQRATSTSASGRRFTPSSTPPSAATARVVRARTPLTRSSEAGKESDDDARLRSCDLCHAMSATEVSGKTLLDPAALSRTLTRIAHEIIEGTPDLDELALVGIQTRGVPLAQRLARLIDERAGTAPALGAVDITFYRDDVTVRGGEAPLAAQPVVRATQLDFLLDGRTVVLVDDVLYTGRTIRAAIEALFDYGRPARVRLAVLVDRGHRELPIRPDYVGKNLPTSRSERIQVQLVEVDEIDAVLLVSTPEEETR
jgi:pyrimidine operon attenuation protein / uracil phosphoribosyltransferase